MLHALRTCPASLSRQLPSVAASRALRVRQFQLLPALRAPVPRIPKVAAAAFHHSTRWQQVAAAEEQAGQAEQDQAEDQAEDGPITLFKDLGARNMVHRHVIDVLTQQMKLETMTDVQTRTINEALGGADVIAQAKTGTGKTLGFLIPVIQRIINSEPALGERPRRNKRARSDDIRAIIISPTRELAEQIAVEAKKITFNTGLVVQVAVGGTQKRAMLMQTQRQGCHILIATPGRLYDVLSDEYSGIAAPKLDAMVMDEADRLLDDGFQKEIEQINQLLPDPQEKDRQTLMFSATVPREVVDLVRRTLKPGFHFANCVNENEAPTHERVPQKVVYLNGFENTMPALYELALRQHQAAKTGDAKPFKAIIYFNSTAEVTLAASVFFKLAGGFKRDKPLHGLNAYEIHAKLTQSQRTQATEKFRSANNGVLFSSDVTARGMDFPNVSHVIQVGLPRDRDTYIHRIGRTARAGKEGEGWLFASPLERHELRKRLRGLPLSEDTSLETASHDMTTEGEVPEHINNIIQEVVDVHKRVYPDHLDAAFRGVFGSYQWYNDKRGLVEAANRWAEFGWGMETPPPPPSFASGGGGRPRGGGYGQLGDRRGGGFGGGRSGGFGDRRGGGSLDDRRSRGGFDDRRSGGGFDDRRSGGGFDDRRSGGGFDDRRSGGGFDDRRSGGYGDRRGRGYGGDGRGGDSRRSRGYSDNDY